MNLIKTVVVLNPDGTIAAQGIIKKMEVDRDTQTITIETEPELLTVQSSEAGGYSLPQNTGIPDSLLPDL